MLNFIYGALTMWFALGGIILLCDTFTEKQKLECDVWFAILITFPFFIVFYPFYWLFSYIKFNWEHEWRWKVEEIKEKIKYRY